MVRNGLLAGAVSCGAAPPADPVLKASALPSVVAPPAPAASAAPLPDQEKAEAAPIHLREYRPVVPTMKCALPSRLVQGGTVHDAAPFRGDVLVSSGNGEPGSEAHSYDPESLQPKPPPPPQPIEEDESGFVTLAAGLRVESGIGVATDVATGRVVLEVGPCNAGGVITYSLSNTGRYLECNSSRTGLSLWDLRSPHPDPEAPLAARGPGVRLSPNDVYAVEVPAFSFAVDNPPGDSVRYYSLARRSSRTLSPARDLDRDNPYEVAFCGDGSIFAVSGEHELTIYRGSDGTRIAGAPAKKGGHIVFSGSGEYVSQTRGLWTTVYRVVR